MNDLKLFEQKNDFFNQVVQNTMLHVQQNKMLNIILETDYNSCIQLLTNVNDKISLLTQTLVKKYDREDIIQQLQTINNELSSIIKTYGTKYFEQLLTVCFGNNKYFNTNDPIILSKNELLKRYFHPTSYKVLQYNNDESKNNLECCDIMLTSNNFHIKIYGLKVYITNISINKCLVVSGFVDDVVISLLNNTYITKQLQSFQSRVSSSVVYDKYISSLNLKEILVYNENDIYTKYIGYTYLYKMLKNKSINTIIKEFILTDLYSKRNMFLLLFYNLHESENMIITYILYDILSTDNNISEEQNTLLNSLPLNIRQKFYSSIKQYISVSRDNLNKDIQTIPLEQRIQLMKTPSHVKDKAFVKLKEIKSKSEDNTSKPRHYLDGLLNIPFGMYQCEPILKMMDDNREIFTKLINLLKQCQMNYTIPPKAKYTNIEMNIHIKNILTKIQETEISSVNNIQLLKVNLFHGDKHKLLNNVQEIYTILDIDEIDKSKSITKKSTKNDLKQHITKMIQTNEPNLQKLYNHFIQSSSNSFINEITNHINHINQNNLLINNYLCNVRTNLDDAVHGNSSAKMQIEKIISQWINGENKGYCFGFEGPPGVGKTTLAKKGIATCLKDNDGNCRPFAFIQMGGDTNGSTLHGHNYTYVGSNWGSIIQILMDTQVMNPIIYIDEVDKISKTENGRELIGILTHLLDFSQNDKFQDKFFNGIDIDMSKTLFILSYNDPSSIDPILLDRIHRIKFQYLSTEDKIVITKKHLLPEVLSNMGLDDMVVFSDEAIIHLIDKYTLEPGVRKLKELMFEIVGELNINIFKNKIQFDQYPIHIHSQDIHTYLKERHEVIPPKINDFSQVGIINGMWANSLGQGGILPLFVKFYPSANFFDLKLTGLLEKVMQESMHVAETLSWFLTPVARQEQIMSNKNNYGIHIHAGEGAISKDGPSGGAAITTLIYSLLNDLKIRHNFAITGEIDLNGNVCEIGGLELKIIGSMKSGVTSFIFPHKNITDYQKMLNKYEKNMDMFNNISFYPVHTIHEVFELIFDN